MGYGWKCCRNNDGKAIRCLIASHLSNFIQWILLFFHDTNLWESDGTAGGTVKVTDGIFDYNNPFSVMAGTTKFYFVYSDQANGLEVWVSDGTTAGTHVIKDIHTSSAFYFPQLLAVINDIAYFS